MTYVLDTNIVIYFLGGRLLGPLPPGWYVVSVVTQIELLSYNGLSAADRDAIRAFLDRCLLAPVTAEIGEIASGLRMKHRLKTPDAIVLATAIHVGATLLTNDNDLLGVAAVSSQPVELA